MPHPSLVSKIQLRFRRADNSRVSVPGIVINGHVWSHALAWLVEEATQGEAHSRGSRLEALSTGLFKFAQFYEAYGQDTDLPEVLKKFSLALDTGDLALGWKTLQYASADKYFDALSRFCDWLALQPELKDFSHPNPYVRTKLSSDERKTQSTRLRETDLLYHLRDLSSKGVVRLARKYSNRNRFRRASVPTNPTEEFTVSSAARRNPKGISLDDYLKLLRTEKNPRNALLWLALGAGACRVSEALQIFATDIFFDPAKSEAVVALANPVRGAVMDENGTLVPRELYLKQRYRMQPRCDLPKSESIHVGWKGMIERGFLDESETRTFEWEERRWAQMYFLLPAFGRMFWKAHQQYVAQRLRSRPQHPYYFVNLARARGRPLTRSNVTQLLKTACLKAGIKPVGPHKLRHMYGNCLAAWEVPLARAQILMRHARASSTAVYYRIPEKLVREHLKKVELQNRISEDTGSYPWMPDQDPET